MSNIKNLFFISSIYTCEAINLYFIYPFIPFLLIHYKTISNIQNVGLYSGLFSSLYFFGQFICNYPIGRISDKVGRKKFLLFGLLLSCITNILFGISSTLYFALFSRFCLGLLNSNPGLAKAYIGDISNTENRTYNYSFLILAWGIGSIIGYLIGGNTFIENSNYPALIPCFISLLISLITMILIYLFLDESIKNPIELKNYYFQLINKTENKLENNIDINIDIRVIKSIAIYLIMCIIDISITETSLIWMVSNKSSGGLEFNEYKISLVAFINSLCGLISVPILWYIEKYISKITLLMISILIVDFLIIFIPFISEMKNNFEILCIFSSFRTIIINIIFNLIYAFISSYNIINIGKVNGISQSLSGLTKIISPIISTNLYTWTINYQNKYIDYHFTSYILVIISFAPLLLTIKLTDKLNNNNNDNNNNNCK
jgi:MFS family permease